MKNAYAMARERVAFFDLQAEGRFKISGANALSALNPLFSMDLAGLRQWKGAMGLFLTEAAEIIAIATVFKGDEEFFVFTEASSIERLRAHLAREMAAGGATFEDLGDSHAWLATVGPRAQETMVKIAGEELIGLPYLSWEDNAPLGAKIFRMGNTGEFEYRLLVPAQQRETTTEAALTAGAEFGIGQADPDVLATLMLEMRSLAATDLPTGTSPIDAGLQWMIGFRKSDLRAGDVLHTAKHSPRSRAIMVCLQSDDSVDRGDRLEIAGEDVGFLASAAFSPTLAKYIGVAYVKPELGWVGVPFDIKSKSGNAPARAVSAPLFLTKTAQSA
ncbi:MAG: aminomethyl transferase family protein [Candidatus Obscuribacterales bacterium]|nr:aminomethyl transferase family protein [Steroidobacteraceae bacterium]